ncbi:CRTAC1 family protein [Paenibacillus elgii]|uniref:CRTAC1 family protein n=1 Tax=Paenibacillus elgii TaxID=189691 RepID=UPI0013D55BC2|nr:CRTAC1 family protein [Paenibacillus elgii]
MKSIIRVVSILSAGLILMAGCSAGTGGRSTEYGISYTDITEQAGIKFKHEKAQFDSKGDNIMPWLQSTGAGVAVGDYDGDGLMDLYFISSKANSMNALYHNNGDGTFTDVAPKLGLADVNREAVSETALWIDYDNSGHPSLFIGKWGGASQLFHNNGDGTFTDVSEKSGVSKYIGNYAKAISLDYNRDGFLDIYLGGYFHEKNNLFHLTTTKIMHNDFEKARNGGKNVMLRNNGDGTFTDVADELGVEDRGWTLATAAGDLNNDGWPDLYNANDFGPDVLYLNEEGKRFKRVIQPRGIGDDTYKGMNADFADVFHDGNLAIYVTNVSKSRYILEGNQLWHPNAQGQYVDRAEEMGINLAGFSWGARFFDADNSGNFSLMVTNGFISAGKQRDYWFDLGTLATTPGTIVEDMKNWPAFGDKSLSGYEKKRLFWNNGKTFKDIAQETGITFDSDSRGVAAVDLWNRGVLDLVFANQGAQPKVYKTTNTTNHNWIKLELTGTAPSNREAVGARVTFEVKGVKTVMERDGGNSHGAQSEPRLHFGLGDATQADKITIRWPSGRLQELTQVKANQILKVTEPDGPVPAAGAK